MERADGRLRDRPAHRTAGAPWLPRDGGGEGKHGACPVRRHVPERAFPVREAPGHGMVQGGGRRWRRLLHLFSR